MAQNITLMGASYSAVPAVQLPKTGGGTATFTDVTDTTAATSDVASGKYFYTSAGVRTEGTASGGGGVDPEDLEIVVSPSSATGTAQTGVAQTEAPNYIPSGDITVPELDYEFKDGKLYIYGIKQPRFVGSGVKLILKENDE